MVRPIILNAIAYAVTLAVAWRPEVVETATRPTYGNKAVAASFCFNSLGGYTTM